MTSKSSRNKITSILSIFFACALLIYNFQNCGQGFDTQNLTYENGNLSLTSTKLEFSDASFIAAPPSNVSDINSAPKNIPFSGNGHNTTWDGRLVIYSTTGLDWAARVFRPESTRKVKHRIALDTAFSPPVNILANFKQNGYDYTRDTLGNRSILVQLNAITFAPATGDPTFSNPYRSDANGVRVSDPNSKYETYDLLIYTQVYNHPGLGELNPEVLQFPYGQATMGQMRMQIIVENPKTPNATVFKSKLIQDFMPITTVHGDYIIGIEPSVTVDGMFFVYHKDDVLHYTYNPTVSNRNSWAQPQKITNLFYDRNIKLNGKTIGELYLLAREPLRANDGTPFSRNQNLMGAYPWLAWDGTELFFQASHAHHPTAAAQRSATSVIGRWTGYKLRHLDNHFNTDSKGTKTVRLFTSGVASTSSQWNPFREILNPIFPSGFETPAYLIVHSNGANFAEVGFRDYSDGRYVLSMEMNPVVEANGRDINFNKTPDLSRNDFIGILKNGAKFKLQNGDTSTLEGAKGHGIFFNSNSSVEVSHKTILNETSAGYTVELFVKPLVDLETYSANSFQYLVNKNNSFNLILEKNHKISLTLVVDGKTHRLFNLTERIHHNSWTHFAFTHDPTTGLVQIFQNGRLTSERKIPVGLLTTSINPILIGPSALNPQVPGNIDILVIDEFKVSNVIRSSVEIADSAFLEYNQRKPFADNNYRVNLPNIYKNHHFRFPEEVQISSEKVLLGKNLFNDTRLSKNGKVSCATCHSENKSFTDGLDKSLGVTSKKLTRNSPTVANRIFATQQHWDGKFHSLSQQIKGPIEHADELGMTSLSQLVTKLKAIPFYENMFKNVFGGDITEERVQIVLAAFQANLVFSKSKYDKFLLGEMSLTNQENRGRNLYFGKARCASCHSGVNLTDEKYHNNGLTPFSTDLGRFAFTQIENDRRAFKTPTLRNVNLTSP